jgi:hypothetical protein
MTFLEKIKPHLLSDDFLIQEVVLHAIHDYPCLPEEWTVALLKEAFAKKDKLLSILVYIDQQPINEEALKVLLENISKMDKSNVHLALNLLNNVEAELALKYREQLSKFLRTEEWELFELIENGSEEEVYTEFTKSVNALDGTFEHELYVRAKKLAKCLVVKGWISEKEIDLVMEEELKEDWFSFSGIMAIYMIGLLKLEKYTQVLASLLVGEDDNLMEEAAAALIRFQNDAVVREIEPYLKKSNSIIYAASVVENIKTDIAVQVLREAYHQDEEIDNQDLIIEAVCHHFSKESLPEVAEHMKREEFSALVDVEEVVYSYYSIIGEQHPELEKWRQRAMEGMLDYREYSERERGIYVAAAPVRNETKVGRNDPCPCGSGKKYKKCCGK